MCKPKSAAIVESNRLTTALGHSRHSWRSYAPSPRRFQSHSRRRWTNLRPSVRARHLAGHVLLVDDVHEDSLLLADLLIPRDTNVMVARSTAEALAMLDE